MKIVTMVFGAAAIVIISLFLLFALAKPAHAYAAVPPGAGRPVASGLSGHWLPWRSGASFVTVIRQGFRPLPSWWN